MSRIAKNPIPVPKGVSMRDAACAPIGFSTVEHMLFDNAKLKSGETILVQAGGSGIGTTAIGSDASLPETRPISSPCACSMENGSRSSSRLSSRFIVRLPLT